MYLNEFQIKLLFIKVFHFHILVVPNLKSLGSLSPMAVSNSFLIPSTVLRLDSLEGSSDPVAGGEKETVNAGSTKLLHFKTQYEHF